MKDECLDFVCKADNCTHQFTSERIFRKNPASFVNNVFNSVYRNEELFELFVSMVLILMRKTL